jgi:hypothetical protein
MFSGRRGQSGVSCAHLKDSDVSVRVCDVAGPAHVDDAVREKRSVLGLGHAREDIAPDDRALLFECFSLCLSRAWRGLKIVFSSAIKYKMGVKRRFAHLTTEPCAPRKKEHLQSASKV